MKIPEREGTKLTAPVDTVLGFLRCIVCGEAVTNIQTEWVSPRELGPFYGLCQGDAPRIGVDLILEWGPDLRPVIRERTLEERVATLEREFAARGQPYIGPRPDNKPPYDARSHGTPDTLRPR